MKEMCIALDNDGKRCRRRAVRIEHYHGDSEIYGTCNNDPWPCWVRAAFCDEHSVAKATKGAE